MRIEQLEYVAAVVEHGSLRRASARMHVSLPALSEAITKLERELGVQILDRGRGGAKVSRRGRELLASIDEVLDSVARLRAAAGAERSRRVRVGTVAAATSTLLVPAVRDSGAGRGAGPEVGNVTVEVESMRTDEIHAGLADGMLDLGLVNALDDEPAPPGLWSTTLLQGRPVVVLAAGDRLADRLELGVDDLRATPFVSMREGYVMHRFAHRLFGARMPPVSYVCDGGEAGKTVVAQGLGFTLLPDYSVYGDPLHVSGVLVAKPLLDDVTQVRLELRRRPHDRTPEPVQAFAEALRGQAQRWASGVLAAS